MMKEYGSKLLVHQCDIFSIDSFVVQLRPVNRVAAETPHPGSTESGPPFAAVDLSGRHEGDSEDSEGGWLQL